MSARHRAPHGLLRGSLLEVADLVLARECGGCARAGTAWCLTCAELLTGAPVRRPLLPPDVRTPLPSWSTARYEDAVRTAVVAWKDRGRADLTGALAPALRTAVQAALGEVGGSGPSGLGVLLVPAPSSRRARRERGYDPVRELARRCGLALRRRGVDVRSVPALVHGRRVADQAQLGVQERARNLAGAVRVGRGWRRELAGQRCLVVDDVVTTGATVLECARALREAGALVVGAAAVAGTPRRGESSAIRAPQDR